MKDLPVIEGDSGGLDDPGNSFQSYVPLYSIWSYMCIQVETSFSTDDMGTILSNDCVF